MVTLSHRFVFTTLFRGEQTSSSSHHITSPHHTAPTTLLWPCLRTSDRCGCTPSYTSMSSYAINHTVLTQISHTSPLHLTAPHRTRFRLSPMEQNAMAGVGLKVSMAYFLPHACSRTP